MSSRKDIGTRRISYTRRCGWIDWGHAEPGGPRKLLDQMVNERGTNEALRDVDLTLEGTPAFVLTYGQRMGKRIFGFDFFVSTDHIWVVRKGLTSQQRERVALGIF